MPTNLPSWEDIKDHPVPMHDGHPAHPKHMISLSEMAILTPLFTDEHHKEALLPPMVKYRHTQIHRIDTESDLTTSEKALLQAWASPLPEPVPPHPVVQFFAVILQAMSLLLKPLTLLLQLPLLQSAIRPIQSFWPTQRTAAISGEQLSALKAIQARSPEADSESERIKAIREYDAEQMLVEASTPPLCLTDKALQQAITTKDHVLIPLLILRDLQSQDGHWVLINATKHGDNWQVCVYDSLADDETIHSDPETGTPLPAAVKRHETDLDLYKKIAGLFGNDDYVFINDERHQCDRGTGCGPQVLLELSNAVRLDKNDVEQRIQQELSLRIACHQLIEASTDEVDEHSNTGGYYGFFHHGHLMQLEHAAIMRANQDTDHSDTTYEQSAANYQQRGTLSPASPGYSSMSEEEQLEVALELSRQTHQQETNGLRLRK